VAPIVQEDHSPSLLMMRVLALSLALEKILIRKDIHQLASVTIPDVAERGQVHIDKKLI
jgi:hypothetical protein